MVDSTFPPAPASSAATPSDPAPRPQEGSLTSPLANRRTFLTGAAAVTALTFLPAALRGSQAYADSPADYPEYPYPTTKIGAYDEYYRGQFHFSSRIGWMNDINGPLYYRGTYHMFYQHNPHGLVWDTMHWGHATSPDLVHWTQQAVALEPGVQPGNLWSGAGVVDKHNVTGLKKGPDDPIVVFTGTGGVLMDYSTDGARTFTSYGNGRVVAAPPAASTDSRDPKVLWDEAHQKWVMVFWSNEGGNGYDIYTSTNLLDWTYASRLTADWLFECPDMYPMRVDGGSTVKWVINAASTKYVVGDFDGTHFTTDWTAPQQMDVGRNAYAGQVFNDMPDGRIVQMAWQQGNFGTVWTGNATFPAELRLVTTPAGLRVTRQPIAEIASLRTGGRTWSDRMISADPAGNPLAGISADGYEVIAEFDTTSASATSFGVRVHTYADGTGNADVVYDLTRQTLMGTAMPPVNGRVKIRVLVDRGQLEVFGNDGLFSSSNNLDFDPALAARGIAVHAEGGRVRLVSLQFHELRRAWPDFIPTTNPGSNIAGPWQAHGGTWKDLADGNKATAHGQGFYLGAQSGTDFRYEADVSLDGAAAAGLTFRADATARHHYTATLDAAQGGQVTLWRPGAVLATHTARIDPKKSHHLAVTAVGPHLQVFLDGAPAPVIDVTDTTYGSGLFGLNVQDGAATLRNANAGLLSDLTGDWQLLDGSIWTDTPAGRRGWATADGFLLNSATGSDFSYEADLSLGSAVAIGLTFRADATASGHYTANINTSGGGQIKLWRPGLDIATHSTPITPGQTYHLKVVAEGARLRVFLGDDPNPVIDALDSTYGSGRFGINVFSGAATFQQAELTQGRPPAFTTNLAGPWHTVSGAWAATADGQQGAAPGDGFSLSSSSGTDFRYEADLSLGSAAAAGLTFRADATASAHYTANINTSGGGQIKLWRPGQDIATYATPVDPQKSYHLKVVTSGPRIQVFLGDGTAPVIDVTDTTYGSGLLGLNVYDGAMTAQNAEVH
ncbi:fructan beta-fructosidase [Actinacidiphila yanglinensis]|uniref:Fructan beta-fructosidase n=1 Tax=Actinacidiphila yanglinensis TaxID=310779 RepID=A0A1H6BW72_9ACTN|nr:glycoside hydrolase family 32 protein [Actinacidiphila yanglinensis]SEG64954.1 fructan beta-fructosidase [Actinacidiphila yanglinensis]